MPRDNASYNIHGLPRIDTLRDLATHVGFSGRQLWWLLVAKHRAYAIFRVAKKSGGIRSLARPNRPLRLTQRWILRNILDRLHTTPSCFGFERGSNLRRHAEQHSGAAALLTVDIESFFPSISIGQVTSAFRAAGYASRAASILARLCTCLGALPQGAPSSPRLANLICHRMDRRLAGFARKRELVYTRYADDLTFSCDSAAVLAKARPMIARIIRDCGFRLNSKKTRFVGPRGSRRVTGLVVAPDRVGIGRHRLRELRAKLHRLHTQSASVSVDSIQGWLDYVSDVDPHRYAILARYIRTLTVRNANSELTQLRLRA